MPLTARNTYVGIFLMHWTERFDPLDLVQDQGTKEAMQIKSLFSKRMVNNPVS